VILRLPRRWGRFDPDSILRRVTLSAAGGAPAPTGAGGGSGGFTDWLN